jgi:SEFIR domain
VDKLTELRERLSVYQREMLTAIWDHYREQGHWLPRRRLHHRFVDRLQVNEVRAELERLGGCVVFETSDDEKECYALLFLGVLLTDHGPDLEELCIRYLEYVRDQYLREPDTESVSSKEVQAGLGISREQAQVLGCLIAIGNLYSRGASGLGGPEWSAGIPDDVDSFPHCKDLRFYLRSRTLRNYGQAVPITQHGLIQYWLGGAGLSQSDLVGTEVAVSGEQLATPSEEMWGHDAFIGPASEHQASVAARPGSPPSARWIGSASSPHNGPVMVEPRAPKALISYSHDSREHEERVLAFADSLVSHGIVVALDQYETNPAEGWPLWMERHIQNDDFVLMVCTETYRRRVMKEDEGNQGFGVCWEAHLIRQHLYDAKAENSRFIPVLFPGGDVSNIPTPLRGATYYRLGSFDFTDQGFTDLYRRLTNQPGTPRPPLGELKRLPVRPRGSAPGQEVRLQPPLAYQVNALTQVVEDLKRDGHARVHLDEFNRILMLCDRDGISPRYEPLTLPSVSEGIGDLIQKGRVAVEDGYLVIL